MRRTTTFHSSLIVAALLSAYLGGPPDILAQVGNATLYEGATLILGDDSPPIQSSAFVVQDGKFLQVGTRGQVRVPAGANRVDLAGKTVMPALVDTHVHAGIGQRDAWLDWEAQRQGLLTELHQQAYAGIAVVATPGHSTEPAFQIRAEYHPNAARLRVSGLGAKVPLAHMPETIERHEAGLPSRYEEDMNDVEVWIHNERQARLYVRERAAERVDHIKLWVDDRLGTELLLSPEIYSVIIDEAHKHDIPVFTHIWWMRDAKGVARAGGDMLAHPVRSDSIDAEFVQLMQDHGVVQQTNFQLPWRYTMTLADAETTWEDPLFLEMEGLEAARAQRERAARGPEPRTHEGQAPDVDALELNSLIYWRIVYNHRTLYDAGVRIALGTESGLFGAHKALELLVDDVGLTPVQAITVATRNSAEALGLLHQLGTVETGKTASFVVLNANPVDDITNTRRIDDVYLHGHRVDRDMIRRTYLAGS